MSDLQKRIDDAHAHIVADYYGMPVNSGILGQIAQRITEVVGVPVIVVPTNCRDSPTLAYPMPSIPVRAPLPKPGPGRDHR